MTRESVSEGSTISTSLSSIIRTSLSKHASTVQEYDARRPELKLIIRQLNAERFPDENTIKWKKWLLRRWSRAIFGYEVLSTLADRIDTNPFPTERLTLRKIAYRLVPHIKSFTMDDIFDEFNLAAIVDEKFYFPAEADSFDIEEIEENLRNLLREGGTVLVKDAREVLHWATKSKTYQEVKRALERKGWRWQRTKTERRIVAPKGDNILYGTL